MQPMLAGDAEHFCLQTCPFGGSLMVLMFGSCWSGCLCTPAFLPPLHGFLLLWVYEGVIILDVCSEAHGDKMIWEICSRTSQQQGLDLMSFFRTLLGVVSSATPFRLERKYPEQILSFLRLLLLLIPTWWTWAMCCWQRNTWKSLGMSLL